jgi:hypothetical protein
LLESLAKALDELTSKNFDYAKVAKSAQQFSTKAFAQNIKTYIQSKVQLN